MYPFSACSECIIQEESAGERGHDTHGFATIRATTDVRLGAATHWIVSEQGRAGCTVSDDVEQRTYTFVSYGPPSGSYRTVARIEVSSGASFRVLFL
jgi:hypothetical protein